MVSPDFHQACIPPCTDFVLLDVEDAKEAKPNTDDDSGIFFYPVLITVKIK